MVTCHILNYVDKLSYSVKNENKKGGGGVHGIKIRYLMLLSCYKLNFFFYFNDQHITGSIKLCDGNLKKYY